MPKKGASNLFTNTIGSFWQHRICITGLAAYSSPDFLIWALASAEEVTLNKDSSSPNFSLHFIHYNAIFFMWIPRDGCDWFTYLPLGNKDASFSNHLFGIFLYVTMSNYPTSDIEANDICPVCHEVLVGKAIKRVRFCQHKFCKECFAKLLKVKLEEPDENLVKPKCPLCRGPIRINEVRTLQ